MLYPILPLLLTNLVDAHNNVSTPFTLSPGERVITSKET